MIIQKRVRCIDNKNVENFLNADQCYFVLNESNTTDQACYCLENLPQMWFRKDRFVDAEIAEDSAKIKAWKQIGKNTAQIKMLKDENQIFEYKIKQLQEKQFKVWKIFSSVIYTRKDFNRDMEVIKFSDRLLRNLDLIVLLSESNVILFEIMYPTKK